MWPIYILGVKVISLHVDERVYAELKARAHAQNRPVAQLVREAMEAWLLEHPTPERSVLDIEPIDVGAPLRPFDRDEVADEMYGR